MTSWKLELSTRRSRQWHEGGTGGALMAPRHKRLSGDDDVKASGRLRSMGRWDDANGGTIF
jgi:hypothetical protein